MHELPASFVQEDIVSSTADDWSNNNVSVVLNLTGQVDRAALQSALDALAERHETLRTSFRRRSGLLLQRVARPAPVPLAVVDLRAYGNAHETMATSLTHQLQEAFYLTGGGLLWRVALFLLDRHQSVLALTLNHTIADRWSAEVLRRDIAALYGAAVTGRTPALSPLALQFGDFAAWQRSTVHHAHVDRWRDRLTPLPPVPDLPDIGRWRPGEPCTIAARPFPAIPATVTAALNDLTVRQRATVADAIHAATAAAFSPYFETEMLLGVVYAIRDTAELQAMIGPLIDHLPVRVIVTPRTTFLDLIHQLSAAFHHPFNDRLPLAPIAAALTDQQPPDRPLFAVQVNYFPARVGRTDFAAPITAARVGFAHFETVTTDRFQVHADREFPLATRLGFVVRGNPDGSLEGAVFANADALGWQRLSPLGAHFAATLSLLTQYPDEPIRSLPLMPAGGL